MENNYEFWKQYLKKIVSNIENLIKEKDFIYCDFHMHSLNSADSDQTLIDIINRTTKLGFDIISITDHDSVKVYDELFEYLKSNDLKRPIIVPGVEFTIDNKDYGSQFHILQLMINPKDDSIKKDVLYQENACKNRACIQLERLQKNLGIKYFIDKYDMKFSMEGYENYLNTCSRQIYEYKTLMEYIMRDFIKYDISNWDILEKVKSWNLKDDCIDRRNLKIKAYDMYYERYKDMPDSKHNFRFFHNLLAVRGADDDFYPEYKCMGDLSVNNFNELKIEQLNRNNLTIFAHPSESKLYLLKSLKDKNSNICGMEYNKRCFYKDSSLFYEILNSLDMIKIIGSDSHDVDSNLYDDLDFYKMGSDEIKQILSKYKVKLGDENES